MTTPASMSAVMDQLVAGARSSRDGVFNTLDAVERRSRAANTSLVLQVAKVCAEHPKHPGAAAAVSPDERDSRFDPEDQWEMSAPAATAAAADDRHDGDGIDGYGTVGSAQTWLR